MHRAVISLLLAVSLLGCKKREVVSEPASEAQEEGEAVSRCKALGEPFVLGDIGALGEGEEVSLPFSAEVGQGVAFDGGFAVGASFERAGEKVVGVVVMGEDGKGARLIDLGKARGDIGPPRVAARGSALAVALVEPDKEGRSIRLATIQGERSSFGGTLYEKRDESLALDLALGEEVGLVAWDEEGEGGGKILLSSFDPATASSSSRPRIVSSSEADAESPKLIAHKGGFFLAYIARHGESRKEDDERYVTEEVGFRAIELVSLDPKGSPQAIAKALTPRDGHVATFDMTVNEDGVMVVWREDDGPSGTGGGRILRAVLRGDEVGEAELLSEERIGGGAPSVFGRWLSISDSSDITRIARLSPAFALETALQPEATIGNGEILAARDDVLFVATLRGRGIRLATLGCGGR